MLAAGLAIAVLYAAFASGAIRIPDESRLQLLVAAIALPTLAATLFGALRFEASGRVALGYLAVAVVVTLYALGGKLVPWVEIPGLFDLDHANGISRLRAPIEYWNALGLFCVLAVPVAVRVAADLERSIRFRAAGLVALLILLSTLALTYSRGGLLVLVAALALLVVIGPDRVTMAAVAGIVDPRLGAGRPHRIHEQRPHLDEDRRAVGERPDRRRSGHARAPPGRPGARDGAPAACPARSATRSPRSPRPRSTGRTTRRASFRPTPATAGSGGGGGRLLVGPPLRGARRGLVPAGAPAPTARTSSTCASPTACRSSSSRRRA